MKKLLYILLFPLAVNGQVVVNLSPDSTLWDLHVLGEGIDSAAFDRYYATLTFRLGPTGETIAEIDTSASPGDTIRFYITGSAQPSPTTVANASIDTSLKVGASGVTWDSITLNAGQFYWWSGGQDFNISQVIYTTPNAPSTLTISSPDSDTLTYATSGFSSPANGTVSDSAAIRWDTTAIPTVVTAGYQVYLGDTSNISGDFFIDMADSLEVYVSAFAKNDGTLGTGTWSVAKTDSVFIDSTGSAGFSAEYQAVYDAMVKPPQSDTANAQNTLVVSGLTNGWFSNGDVIYVFAVNNGTDALLNWVAPTGDDNATDGNTTLFTEYQGYTGDGSTDWLNTNFTPSTEGVNFTQDDACVAVYARSDINALECAIGASAVGRTAYIYPRSSGNFIGRLNDITSSSDAETTSQGLSSYNRSNSTTTTHYKNGADQGDNSSTSVSLPNVTFNLLRLSASAGHYSNNQLSFVYIGGALTDQEQIDMNADVEVYLDYVGAGVE